MIPSNLLKGPGSLGRTGLCQILVYTTGDDSYFDANGNGIFDTGDTCTGDLPEPFIDANDNGTHDALELYVDVNQNGTWDDIDTVCSSDTTIWTSMNLLMTGDANLVVERETTPDTWVSDLSASLAIGESQRYRITYGDVFENAVVAGTSLAVEQIQGSGGLITGTTGLTQGDTTGAENTAFFTVHSDIDPSATPELLEIQVTLGSSEASLADSVNGSTHANNNGSTLFGSFTVAINNPVADTTAPSVQFTVPSDGATNVGVDAPVTIVFDEPMNPLTVTTATVSAVCGGTPYVFGSIAASNDDTTFTLAQGGSPFPAGVNCEVTISTGVRDIANNAMNAAYIFDFDTQ
jgi:adhesin/invasin